jgi:hypothetical protein
MTGKEKVQALLAKLPDDVSYDEIFERFAAEVSVNLDSPKQPKARPSVMEQEAFGMWADREDMADPVAWVRKQREPRQFDIPRDEP